MKMRKETPADLAIVHLYLDRIIQYIQQLVPQESHAIVLACQVLQEHHDQNCRHPFTSEENRLAWLLKRARDTAIRHLKNETPGKTKTKAFLAALHDHA